MTFFYLTKSHNEKFQELAKLLPPFPIGKENDFLIEKVEFNLKISGDLQVTIEV
jgi:hypothetical protein